MGLWVLWNKRLCQQRKNCRTTTFISNSKRGYFYITVNDRRIIFCYLLNLPIDAYMEWIAPFRHILDIPFRFTVGLMALYAAFGVGASLRELLSAQSVKCRVIICTRLFTSISWTNSNYESCTRCYWCREIYFSRNIKCNVFIRRNCYSINCSRNLSFYD